MKIVAVAFTTLLGCGSKAATPTTPATGSGATTEAAVNGCTTYKDLTEAGADSITWDPSIASSEFRCVKIKVNQTVGYTGNFTTHPIKAAGGATPNPFDGLASAISNPGTPEERANFAFSTPGTYGYVCGVHPEMTGAVLVVQ